MRAALLMLLAASPWTKVSQTDGIETYERAVEGERVVELKLVTVSKLPVDALCTSAFGGQTLSTGEPDVTERKLISFDGGTRITYEQVTSAIVSDRDYAVRSFREATANGGCRTHFEAANQFAPPLRAGFIRIEKLRGGWSFEPMPGGNVVCTYSIFTDPGGSIPAFLVEGPRKSSALQWVKLVLARAAAVDAGSQR